MSEFHNCDEMGCPKPLIGLQGPRMTANDALTKAARALVTRIFGMDRDYAGIEEGSITLVHDALLIELFALAEALDKALSSPDEQREVVALVKCARCDGTGEILYESTTGRECRTACKTCSGSGKSRASAAKGGG